jgi:hypothetical protein
MRDSYELYRDVYWELYDADLNPEDVYDMEAMCANDEPGLDLRALMRNNIRSPKREDENSANILREICMQEGISVYGSSYDVVSDLVNIYVNSQHILNLVK